MFHEIGSRIKKSNFVVVVLGFVIVALVIAVNLWIEDFNTSYAGYKMIPTRKTSESVLFWVALLPQVGTVVFTFAAMSGRNMRWNILIATALQFVDWSTDTYFKSNALESIGLSVVAGIESLVIYTGGSELLLAVTLGILLDIMSPTLERVGKVFKMAFLKFAKWSAPDFAGGEYAGSSAKGNNAANHPQDQSRNRDRQGVMARYSHESDMEKRAPDIGTIKGKQYRVGNEVYTRLPSGWVDSNGLRVPGNIRAELEAMVSRN